MNFIPPLPAMKTPETAHKAVEFSHRLDSVLGPLLPLLAIWSRLLGLFTVPLWNRISRARIRLARILINLAHGHLPRKRAAAPGRSGGAPAQYIPRGNLWLVRKLGHHAAGYGAQLQHLLHEPEFQATLAAAPPSLGRTLRPLCRLLGVPLPESLRPPQRPPRAPKITTPKPRPPRPLSKRALRALIPAHQPLAPQRKPRPLPPRIPLSQKLPTT